MAALMVEPFPAVAQDTVAEPPHRAVLGEFVRVTAPAVSARPFVAKLWAAPAHELVFRPRRLEDAPLVIPAAQVLQVEVRRPTGDTRAGPGALIGTIIGAIGFGIAGYQDTKFGGHNGDFGAGSWGIIAAIPGSGIGALAGMFIGKALPINRWNALPLPLTVSDSLAGFRR